MYKFIIYHPFNKHRLNFTKDVFLDFFKNFPNTIVSYVETENQFHQELRNADFIIGLSFEKNIYKYAKKLKAIFTCMAGRESIPEPPHSKISCYYGSFHGKLISESLLSGMAYFNQKFSLLNKSKEQKIWCSNFDFGSRVQLSKQSIGIFGFGAIGRYCAQYLSKLGMKVYGIQRTHSHGFCPFSHAEYINVNQTDNLIANLNHIVSFLPQSKETKFFFDEKFFSKMSKSACFYNFGRGHCVVEKDLSKALHSQKISGALLDVFQQEPLDKNSILWQTPNLIITPHISTYYTNYFQEYAIELKQQITIELKKTSSHYKRDL